MAVTVDEVSEMKGDLECGQIDEGRASGIASNEPLGIRMSSVVQRFG